MCLTMETFFSLIIFLLENTSTNDSYSRYDSFTDTVVKILNERPVNLSKVY